jgi:hypothetical protein
VLDSGRRRRSRSDGRRHTPPIFVWDDDLSTPIENASAKRILFNITAALQWSGFSVASFIH